MRCLRVCSVGLCHLVWWEGYCSVVSCKCARTECDRTYCDGVWLCCRCMHCSIKTTHHTHPEFSNDLKTWQSMCDRALSILPLLTNQRTQPTFTRRRCVRARACACVYACALQYVWTGELSDFIQFVSFESFEVQRHQVRAAVYVCVCLWVCVCTVMRWRAVRCWTCGYGTSRVLVDSFPNITHHATHTTACERDDGNGYVVCAHEGSPASHIERNGTCQPLSGLLACHKCTPFTHPHALI